MGGEGSIAGIEWVGTLSQREVAMGVLIQILATAIGILLRIEYKQTNKQANRSRLNKIERRRRRKKRKKKKKRIARIGQKWFIFFPFFFFFFFKNYIRKQNKMLRFSPSISLDGQANAAQRSLRTHPAFF